MCAWEESIHLVCSMSHPWLSHLAFITSTSSSSFNLPSMTQHSIGTTRRTPRTPSTSRTAPSFLSRQDAPSRITLAWRPAKRRKSSHHISHRFWAQRTCDCLKDRSLFWTSIFFWCIGKRWRRRSPSSYHRRSVGFWRDWDSWLTVIQKFQRRPTSNRRCISTIPWKALPDSDLEDGELQKMLTSPLYAQKALGKSDAMVVQDNILKPIERTVWGLIHLKVRKLWTNPMHFIHLDRKLDQSSVFRNANPSNLRGSLLGGNKDHLLNQVRAGGTAKRHAGSTAWTSAGITAGKPGPPLSYVYLESITKEGCHGSRPNEHKTWAVGDMHKSRSVDQSVSLPSLWARSQSAHEHESYDPAAPLLRAQNDVCVYGSSVCMHSRQPIKDNCVHEESYQLIGVTPKISFGCQTINFSDMSNICFNEIVLCIFSWIVKFVSNFSPMNTDASNVDDLNILHIKERWLLSCVASFEDWSWIFRTRSFTLFRNERDFRERSDPAAVSESTSLSWAINLSVCSVNKPGGCSEAALPVPTSINSSDFHSREDQFLPAFHSE